MSDQSRHQPLAGVGARPGSVADEPETYWISGVSQVSESVTYGGVSDVHRAEWNGPDGKVEVALKVLRAKEDADIGRVMKTLRNELSIWCGLRHRNVQPLLGVYWDRKHLLPSLVSPWCQNGDINRYLKAQVNSKDTSVNVDHLFTKLFDGVLEGLSYLHHHQPVNIVHGDLKGANVLVSDDGQAKICDFGLASMLPDSASTFAAHSSTKGTIRWMAPELFDDDAASSHTTYSDIWAFGCLIIEVQSGNVPYVSKRHDGAVIIALSQRELPDRPPSISDDLWDITLSCLNMIPKDRPSVNSLLERMRSLPGRQMTGSEPPMPIQYESRMSSLSYLDADLDALSLTVRKVGSSAVHHGVATEIWEGVWDIRPTQAIRVALKYLREAVVSDERAAGRLLREVEILRHLQHKNILPFYGISGIDGSVCLVVPWMQQGSILHILARYPHMDRLRFVRLPEYVDEAVLTKPEMHGVACGLEYLHKHTPRIVHGSLVPSNILVNDSFEAVIGDFGSVKTMYTDGGAANYTTSRGAQDDLRWMAPEVSEGGYGAPADVYAWAMVALNVLSGMLPYWRIRQPGRVVIHVHQGRRPQRDDYAEDEFSDRIWSLLQQCWQHEPEDRPDMEAVIAEIIKDRPDLAS